MDARKDQVLAHVVEIYSQSGEPVGSKLIAKEMNNAVSSATIRNDMATLTKLGLLVQPHTSAGRIPSRDGYQYYIENLMPNFQLSADRKEEIDDFFNQISKQEVDQLIEEATKELSTFTEHASVATTPQNLFRVFGQVEILPTKAPAIVVLLGTTNNSIEHALVRMPRTLSPETCLAIAKRINRKLERVPLNFVQADLFGDCEESYTDIYQVIENLAKESVGSELLVYGTNYLLNQKERPWDPQETLEMIQSDHLKRLLDITGISTRARVVYNPMERPGITEPMSIIASKYHLNGRSIGTIGILGSARIPYHEMVPYVDYFSKRLSSTLQEMLKSNMILIEGD